MLALACVRCVNARNGSQKANCATYTVSIISLASSCTKVGVRSTYVAHVHAELMGWRLREKETSSRLTLLAQVLFFTDGSRRCTRKRGREREGERGRRKEGGIKKLPMCNTHGESFLIETLTFSS